MILESKEIKIFFYLSLFAWFLVIVFICVGIYIFAERKAIVKKSEVELYRLEQGEVQQAIIIDSLRAIRERAANANRLVTARNHALDVQLHKIDSILLVYDKLETSTFPVIHTPVDATSGAR